MKKGRIDPNKISGKLLEFIRYLTRNVTDAGDISISDYRGKIDVTVRDAAELLDESDTRKLKSKYGFVQDFEDYSDWTFIFNTQGNLKKSNNIRYCKDCGKLTKQSYMKPGSKVKFDLHGEWVLGTIDRFNSSTGMAVISTEPGYPGAKRYNIHFHDVRPR